MRINLAQSAVAAAVQAEAGKGTAPARPVQRRANVEAVNRAAHAQKAERPAQPNRAQEPPPPLPESSKLSVSVDDRQNIIYRFLDPDSGDVRRQVPPEEILRIMRNIEDLLKESGRKLNVRE